MADVTIQGLPDQPFPNFAAERLRGAWGSANAPKTVLAVQRDGAVAAEGFRIQPGGEGGLTLTASDDRGFAYGLLDLAERVTMAGGDVLNAPVDAAPAVAMRALKMNLPWSSYRGGRVMTQHMATCRDPAFWRALLDEMAVHRFNTLTLWNQHPFIYMFRPAGFEDACPFDEEELRRWRELHEFIFRAAHERGIDVYMVFWNIFTGPEPDRFAFERLTGEEYHLGRPNRQPWVDDYTRQCVRQLIDEFPDLDGIGFALGERMVGMSPVECVQWLDETILTAAREASRPVRLLCRAPFGEGAALLRQRLETLDWPAAVHVELKFNWSHGHSTPTLAMTHNVDRAGQRTTNDVLWNPPSDAYRMAWMVRNEDIFLLRWGEPDFIRQHIAMNNLPHAGGYIVGSEGRIPADDVATHPDRPRGWDYDFQRQWLWYQLWGRLLYDPATDDARFAEAFNQRYATTQGETLLEAYRLASRMPLRLASFYGATWDYTLYAEGFCAPFRSPGHWDADGGPFISIEQFIDHPTLEPEYLSIRDFVEGNPREGVTPLELAEDCERDAERVRSLVEAVGEPSESLRCELDDLRIWAVLSDYLAVKLRGGVALARYRRDGGADAQQRAIDHLQRGVALWRELIAISDAAYQRVAYIDRARERYVLDFHWRDYLPAVERDVEIARRGEPVA